MQLVILIVMNNKSKLNLFNYINRFTTFFFCYSMVTISFPLSININARNHLKNQDSIHFKYTHTQENNIKKNSNMLEQKLYSDLYFHNILNHDNPRYMTQLSFSQDGKILGYKSSNLRSINYTLEKQVTRMIQKEAMLINHHSNIYWLNLK